MKVIAGIGVGVVLGYTGTLAYVIWKFNRERS